MDCCDGIMVSCVAVGSMYSHPMTAAYKIVKTHRYSETVTAVFESSDRAYCAVYRLDGSIAYLTTVKSTGAVVVFAPGERLAKHQAAAVGFAQEIAALVTA